MESRIESRIESAPYPPIVRPVSRQELQQFFPNIRSEGVSSVMSVPISVCSKFILN
jgi:hypothetical protein